MKIPIENAHYVPGGHIEVKDVVSIDDVLAQIKVVAMETESRLGRLALLERWLEEQR